MGYEEGASMRTGRVNHISGRVMVVLSLVALLTVITGYFQAPQLDEGTGAHIFQLTIAALMPAILIFLPTADWTAPWRRIRFLMIPGSALVLAFGALYYLEHYYWLAH